MTKTRIRKTIQKNGKETFYAEMHKRDFLFRRWQPIRIQEPRNMWMMEGVPEIECAQKIIDEFLRMEALHAKQDDDKKLISKSVIQYP